MIYLVGGTILFITFLLFACLRVSGKASDEMELTESLNRLREVN